MEVQRICAYCKNEWTARKTTSQTCSDRCAKRLYKQRQREKKIEASNNETKNTKMAALREKEYLTVSEAGEYLSVSRWTIWRAINSGTLKFGKLGRKKLIKRTELEKALHQ